MSKEIARYQRLDGSTLEVEYDTEAPCEVCGEPVLMASVGGTAVCPWCDMGQCRYCGAQSMLFKEEIDGGKSLRGWRDHMAWHREHPPSPITGKS